MSASRPAAVDEVDDMQALPHQPGDRGRNGDGRGPDHVVSADVGTVLLGSRVDDAAGAPGREPAALYRWTLLVLAAIPAITHLVRLVTTEQQWQFALYEDDAFYYLGVARSIAEGHGSTFTGLIETNGYHPLWMLLLVPLAALFDDPNKLLVGLALLQAALWALSVREALRIGRAVGCWACAAGAMAVYGVLAVLTGRLAFNGMESALVLPLLLAVVRVGLEADDRPRTDLVLGCLLALVCLARLDAVVAAVPLGLVLLFRDRLPPDRLVQRGLRLCLPAAITLGMYGLVNLMVFDTALPVSGLAKGLGAPFVNAEPLTQFARAGQFAGRSIWFGVLALLAVGWAWRTGDWRHDERRRRLMACTLALVVGQALLLVYLVLGTSYRVWPWYHYQLALFAFLAMIIVARSAAERFGAIVPRACLVTAGAFLVVEVGVTFRPEETPFVESVTGARFVAARLPDDAVLAMGDRAGIFGFLAERPMLHLEGLVADAAYLDDLAGGRAAARMVAEGVDYYVHYGEEGDPVVVDGRPCWRFREPTLGDGPKQELVVCDDDEVFSDGDVSDRLQIWRFRPELNRG
jgi:hypothetical protein